NLLLFGVVAAAFVLAQFRFGPESLLLGPAHDRILAIGNSFSLEFDASPEERYAALFASYKQRYDADFYLINPDGETLAGPAVAVPAEVMERMRRNRPPVPLQARRGPPHKKKGAPPNDDPNPRKKRRPPPEDPPDPEAVFLVITPDPTAYWA